MGKDHDALFKISFGCKEAAQSQLRVLILLRQLRKSFGSIPADVEQRVARANEAQLETWADRILGASSLDDIFATDEE